MKEYQKNIAKMLEVAKHYPVIGAEKLLEVDLPYYQKDMLKRMWTTKYPLLVCSRRTGKTFITAVLLSLKALLYPRTKIGITAPVYRQSQTVFREIEDIRKHSEFFASQSEEPKHSTSAWRIDIHKNDSKIVALPLSDNIRSKGFNIIHVDEYGFRSDMNTMTKRIITPMLFSKRENKLNYDPHPTNIGNQLIISSTATYQFSDLYSRVKSYQEKIEQGNDKYDIISYDYRDGLDSGLFEEEIVLEEHKDADPLTRKMEFLNIFVSSTGGFIDLKLIHNKMVDKTEKYDDDEEEYIPPKTQLEFEQPLDDEGNPKYRYLLAWDDASSGRDNAAYALIKIDNKVKRIVQYRSMDSAPIQEKVEVIRDLMSNFNIVQIVMDQRHTNITDNLCEKYYYNDGEVGEPITMIDKDKKEKQVKRLKREYGNDVDYTSLVKIHNFTGQTNEIRAKHLLGEIEKGRVKIPAEVNLESKKEVEYYKEVKKAINEITRIRAKPSGKYVRYQPPSENMTKDLFTVTELGVYMADELIKKGYRDENEDIYIGKWRTNSTAPSRRR